MSVRKKTQIAGGIILILSLLAGSATAAVRTITARGKTYVPLNNIAAYYSMKTSAPASNRQRLRNQWHTLEFETDSRRIWVNGTLIWLNHPIRKVNSLWTLDATEFSHLVDPAIRPYGFLKHQGSSVVVLDPGHGGKDRGAESPRSVYEKLLVMDVAKRVRTHLQARGITVRFTRDGDQTLTLSQRTQKAASYNADLFVSLHADSAGKTAEGAGSFILSRPGCYSTHSYGQGTPSGTTHPGNRYNRANAILAYRIQQNLTKSTRQVDRGVKHARFKVLREAPCPAALIELAFLSNPKEEALVIQATFREKLAKGVSNGILAYLHDIKRAKSGR